MTTRVRIEVLPGSPEKVTALVLACSPDGDPTRFTEAHVLAPGESVETYLYDQQRVLLVEGEAESAEQG